MVSPFSCYPIFDSSLIQVGIFRCHPSYGGFSNTGPARGHLVVFPRTRVRIIQDGHRPLVADPNIVVFYNKDQEYRREAISRRGDRCEFFHFAPALVADAIRSFDPSVDERLDRPFRFNHTFSSADLYLSQRRVVQLLQAPKPLPDTLPIEECLMEILSTCVSHAFGAADRKPDAVSVETRRDHVELVSATRELLARRFRDSMSLQAIADAVVSSPFHLSRVFRQYTGLTIHEYKTQLRLRTALDLLDADRTRTLTELALELGFASHSHFSTAFRSRFGCTPKQWRIQFA